MQGHVAGEWQAGVRAHTQPERGRFLDSRPGGCQSGHTGNLEVPSFLIL